MISFRNANGLITQKTIQEGLIRYIKDKLDGLLSEMPTEIGSTPSVIKDRNNDGGKAPRPDFPYIMVDRGTTFSGVPSGGSYFRKQYINEDGLLTYQQEHRVELTINCYGYDSDTILAQLHMTVLDDWYRAELNQMTNATFVQFSDIEEAPMFLETDFVDGAVTVATFTAISEWTPNGRGNATIKQVIADGCIEEKDGDEPIVTNITVTGLTKLEDALNGL